MNAAGRVHLARGELVADEEAVAIDCISPALTAPGTPPVLEFEESRCLRVDLGVDDVGLLPVGVGGIVDSKFATTWRRRKCPCRGRRPAPSAMCRPAAAEIARGLRPRRPPDGRPADRSTIGPGRSGRMAAMIVVCQPAWQLATTAGLPSASGCRRATSARKAASALH